MKLSEMGEQKLSIGKLKGSIRWVMMRIEIVIPSYFSTLPLPDSQISMFVTQQVGIKRTFLRFQKIENVVYTHVNF
ncbi:hypothetical protein [Alkaliflexus imshenetskii]|uniref:hypothetical protein n=1 Tax=Alkaliflexus imshenetskii TaxID=286730 RepID=UPI00047E8529|nr:hypothetical protein [Alkaliflexus imshenetskii]